MHSVYHVKITIINLLTAEVVSKTLVPILKSCLKMGLVKIVQIIRGQLRVGSLAYSHGVQIIKDFKPTVYALAVQSLPSSQKIVNLVMLLAATHDKSKHPQPSVKHVQILLEYQKMADHV